MLLARHCKVYQLFNSSGAQQQASTIAPCFHFGIQHLQHHQCLHPPHPEAQCVTQTLYGYTACPTCSRWNIGPWKRMPPLLYMSRTGCRPARGAGGCRAAATSCGDGTRAVLPAGLAAFTTNSAAKWSLRLGDGCRSGQGCGPACCGPGKDQSIWPVGAGTAADHFCG
jgi:hypothetical protein